MNAYRGLWGLLLLLSLAACAAEATPRLMTSEPSQTPRPSATFLPTAPPTFSPRPTFTPAPTRTPIPPGERPAMPLQPTFTLLPATQTATFAPTFNPELDIEYFVTNSNPDTSAGDTTTLFWRVTGADQVRVYRLNDAEERVAQWDVPGEGRLSVELDPTAARTRFVLVAQRGEATREESLEFDTACPTVWFFQPAPSGCPAPAQESTLVTQAFEGGEMIWIAQTREIFVLFADGDAPAWESYLDEFTDGMPDRDENISPPPDRQQPVRGFGLVWRENPTTRARLGWAVAPEIGYDGSIQRTTSPPEGVYLRARDGGVLGLQADGASWQALRPEDINAVQLVPAPTSETTE